MVATKRAGFAVAILAAAGTVGYMATRDAPVCELHTVFAPCGDLLALHGAGHVSACDEGETIGAVLAVRLIGEEGQVQPDAPEAAPTPAPIALLAGWLQPPGLVRRPIDCAAYTWDSDAPEDRVQVVPVSSMHPESIAGTVARDARDLGEGMTTPAEEAHVGYCYGAGCRCAAEPCEFVAIGASDPLYWQKRLCRMYPNADGCSAPEESSAP